MSKSKTLGIICVKKDDRNSAYLKIDGNTNVTINGKPVDNGILTVDSPKTKYDRMLKSGKINEEQYDEYLNQIPEFIKKEITAWVESKPVRFGNLVSGKNNSFYIKLSTLMSLEIDGVPFQSTILSANRPLESLEFAKSKGWINDKLYNEKKEFYTNNDWIKFEIRAKVA